MSLLLQKIALIRRLPETAATASRDYGRGYAQAIRDVLSVLEIGEQVKAQEDSVCNEQGCTDPVDSWGLCGPHLRDLPDTAWACLNCHLIGMHADWCSVGQKRAEP